MRLAVACFVGVLCFSGSIFSSEAPQYINLDSSSVIASKAVTSNFQNQQRQFFLNVQSQYLDFGDMDFGVLVHSAGISVTQPNTPVVWNLKVMNSFSESKMSDNRYLSLYYSGGSVAFNTMSLFGFGGGVRCYSERNIFLDLQANLVWLNNAATRSGLDGYEIELNLGQKLKLGSNFNLSPNVGLQLTTFTGATINGNHGALRSSRSQLSYRWGFEFDYKL